MRTHIETPVGANGSPGGAAEPFTIGVDYGQGAGRTLAERLFAEVLIPDHVILAPTEPKREQA